MNTFYSTSIVLLTVLVGTIIALIIQNLTLKERLEKQQKILSSAQTLSRRMYELGDKEEFFKETWSILKYITNADEFTYFRFDGIDTLIPECVYGVYKEQILNTKLKLGQGFSGKVALERTPSFLNNANKSSISVHVPGTPNEDSALLGLPVIFGTELYGVILLTKLGGAQFTSEELKIAEIFTNILSAFIAGRAHISTIRSGLLDALKTLIAAVELKDTYTAGHSLRVSLISEILAKEIGLPQKEVSKCRIGGLLHDIGKIGLREEILKNGIPLTDELRIDVRKHPELGYELVRKMKVLEGVAEVVLYHHEWYNGKGYPKGLKDGEIPICARIVHVADAIDAMTSGRLHSSRKTIDEAFEELVRFAGIQFDPKIVRIALSSREQIEQVLKEQIQKTILEDEELFEVL
ncbi:MAG: HD domain-containing protein [Caldisericum sp.]|jgi:putative nucleotidyltransferase with HDIG domain|nr:HD domain-containing protein [Caldisericum sp.]